MPEGDAVRRTARRLDQALAGQTLTHADLRVPRYATVSLSGAEIDSTAVVGKHLLTRMRRNGAAVTLHSHLRMEGRWVTGRDSARACAGPSHQIRVWLRTEQAQAVGLRLAMVAVVATDREQGLIGHLGPDILAEDFDVQAAADRVRGQGDRSLGDSVLDQRVISGLGTIWMAELAFELKVSPFSAAKASQPGPGLEAIRRRMQAAVLQEPRQAQRGMAVYGRSRLPCRDCGTVVRSARIGEAPRDRMTYWCPTCQG